MTNLIPSHSSSLRSCRDRIKGRFSLEDRKSSLPLYTELRRRIRNQYPPLRGERLRKTVLTTIGTLAILLSLYVMLAS